MRLIECFYDSENRIFRDKEGNSLSDTTKWKAVGFPFSTMTTGNISFPKDVAKETAYDQHLDRIATHYCAAVKSYNPTKRERIISVQLFSLL